MNMTMRTLSFIFVCCLLTGGCAFSAQTRNSFDFKYSGALQKLTGFDSNGSPLYAQFDGPSVSLDALVEKVDITDNSPSIVIENDLVRFRLKNELRAKDGRLIQIVNLKFDQAALPDPQMFRVGGTWKIVISSSEELVRLEKK